MAEPDAVSTKKKSVKPGMVLLVAVLGCAGLIFMVGMIGIVSAIFIPNFIDALQKAKQKRTIADVRDAGVAWMSSQDGARATEADGSGQRLSLTSAVRLLEDEVVALLQDDMASVPRTDGWEHPLEYLRAESAIGVMLVIRSPGRDGLFDGEAYDVGPFVATDYDRDIVWSNGYFVRWPQASSP